ncbi:hypothetical protein [Flavilitoribacter nigricans]|uniref:Ig-like domain-containing protein n=1 Tax=Flavilitoribacter nigricans (strain ATCC 23147 / DSM 23189 / NBRC 102662 / NCIMB 1420 / SS-2) TaxID=1122177 RepID=A0A2D0N7I3_FLAN2|nr:hypothetical protein [Flavilitoribacter nigricans]PHN03723.1 hypothetical protein CRP01_24525 [Flavilitoribacter nigricans DSM 23189 = NBRC 102662]
MKNTIKTLSFVAIFLLGFSQQTTLQAQGCKSATSVVSDIFNNYGKILATLGCTLANQAGCLDNAQKYAQMTSDMVAYWNKRSKTTSWATIGPRRLDFNQDHIGKIVSTGGRMFISPIPSNKNELTVSIDELDGKGKTSVVICKVDKNNNYFPLATKWFNDTSERKKKHDEKRNFTIKGVKGYLISIHFDGKSVGNTFQYKLKVK